MYYSFFNIPDFFLRLLEKTIVHNSKNLERILVGRQLSLTVFNALNAFIYKLALE